MKKVFSSHSQVCHIWANQSQSEGKASRVFFRDETIYSYGTHYEMAKIHTVRGKKIALVNSYTYSPSTAKHLCHVRRALDGLMNYYHVPNVSDLKSIKNFNHYNDKIIDHVESLLKTVKVTAEHEIRRAFEGLFRLQNEVNEFFRLAEFPEIEIPSEMLDIIQEHLNYRLQRYNELNTPEEIAKREAKKERQKELDAVKETEKIENDIKEWRLGANKYFGTLYHTRYSILRVNEEREEVQTSSGASVPLSHALRLLTLIERDEAREGERVGHFTLTRIQDGGSAEDGDKLIVIGCHEILLSEAQNVLGKYKERALKLVDEMKEA